MKTGKSFTIFGWSLILAICAGMIGSNTECAWYDDAQWYDEYYHYRIPIEVTPVSTGLQILNVSSSTIVDKINDLTLIQHSDTYFDYNRILLVEYDDTGNATDVDDSGTFYLYSDGSNLLTNGDFNSYDASDSSPDNWTQTNSDTTIFNVVSGNGGLCLRVTSETADRHRLEQGSLSLSANTFYLLSYDQQATQNTGGISCNVDNSSNEWYPLETSYKPALKSTSWTEYKEILEENSAITAQVNIERVLTGTAYIDEVSLKKVQIKLLFNPDAAEAKKYMIYYEPTQASRRIVPDSENASVSATSITPSYTGDAGKNETTRTGHVVYTDSNFDLWFMETTEKMGNTEAPSLFKPVIDIHCAKNERQSFQLVLDPRSTMTLDSASVDNMELGSSTIESYVIPDFPDKCVHSRLFLVVCTS